MNITKSSVVGALISLSLVAACGRDDKAANPAIDAGTGGTDSGSGSNGGVVTVKQVQADSMKSGTVVEIHGVVVTAIDSYGGSTGDIWVQDTDGGARSGVHVYGAALGDVAKLAVGDLVDIKGAQKFEYPLKTPTLPSTQTLTEVEGTAKGSLVVTKVGTGSVPAPHPLDSVAIAAMSATDRATFLEDWEGVPVVLANARPTNPGMFGTGGDDQKSFEVENVVTVESNMAAFPTSSATDATCYASITGVIDFVVGKYTLLPLSTSGFVDGGSSCPAPTQFVDATIAEIQAGTKTGYVKLTGVYVMGWSVSSTGPGKTLWLSDTLAAAAGKGVEGFNVTGVDDTIRVLGTKVDVKGPIIEFDHTPGGNTLTEFDNGKASVTLSAAATTAPTALAVDVTQINDIDNSETYEGTLVTIADVVITATGTNNTVTLTDNNGKSITMDDDAFFNYNGTATAAVPAKGTCYKSLTGVMDVQTDANVRTINPRSADDMKDLGAAGVGKDCTTPVP